MLRRTWWVMPGRTVVGEILNLLMYVRPVFCPHELWVRLRESSKVHQLLDTKVEAHCVRDPGTNAT